MGVLKAVLIMTLSVSLLYLGLRIFSQIHCRQKSWAQDFKAITSKIIKSEFRVYQTTCRGSFFHSAQRASLSLNLGKDL